MKISDLQIHLKNKQEWEIKTMIMITMAILTTKGAWGYVWPLDINTRSQKLLGIRGGVKPLE
jgi:hypothetical protein